MLLVVDGIYIISLSTAWLLAYAVYYLEVLPSRGTAVCTILHLTLLTCQIEATDKSASIRVAFSARAAAEDLSRKLRGTTVKIKGVKLHAFVRVSAFTRSPPPPNRRRVGSPEDVHI